ncbi:hypothetical protein RhiirC2_787937 [Rhizophagus irregularis]|uniref:Uncharacterized protein n=1 Tax=Rhizophagus irregularis TaxID=588596 RepID=A0A2N1MR68_9GLOM|nr:hypothetical protein RhiirC2_790895 [Rhizophagus irregularis]PKK64126.1 hypothetical protein RhiirC2_787937 [Rhizophagus irregularis]
MQVTESNSTFGGIIEHEYDLPQIRLHELILDISVNDFQKLWEFSYIATTSSSPTTPHYVVIFKDSSSICTCMSIINKAKTSVQIAVSEGAITEFIGMLMQFNMKYWYSTGFGIEETQDLSMETQSNSRIPLANLDTNNNYNISNPEYHRPKGRTPKRYKSSIEENSTKNTSSKKCGYYGHNIRSCVKYKVDKENMNSITNH